MFEPCAARSRYRRPVMLPSAAAFCRSQIEQLWADGTVLYIVLAEGFLSSLFSVTKKVSVDVTGHRATPSRCCTFLSSSSEACYNAREDHLRAGCQTVTPACSETDDTAPVPPQQRKVIAISARQGARKKVV